MAPPSENPVGQDTEEVQSERTQRAQGSKSWGDSKTRQLVFSPGSCQHAHSLSFSCELSFSISRSAEVMITLLLPCSRTSSLMSATTAPEASAGPQGLHAPSPTPHHHLQL